MLHHKKGWGSRSAWAQSFFDLVPPTAESSVDTTDVLHTPATALSATASPRATTTNTAKLRKRLEQDPRTRWRCRRCHELLHPPLDAATKRPRQGVMMCEHLEGVSSGGTAHLATGVTVCAAGTLRYDKLASSAPQHTPSLSESGDEADRTLNKSTRSATEQDAARKGVVDLLHACQRAALADSKGGNGGGGTPVRRPAPLLFIVVENPKTPANAGGILRAMKCYGVHGPSISSPNTASETQAEATVSPPTSRSDSAGVLQRAGGFIFSGTRLRAAMAHSEDARTDPTHAGRDIPQLCLPSLDVLFEVLRSEFHHHSSTTLVRVVAVELVEGATPLPAYAHPFWDGHTEDSAFPPLDSATTTTPASSESSVAVPMVFYVFGAEDGTLSAHHLERDVDDVVFMPTTGSMNLAATVNVLLYDRAAKECCGVQPAAAVGEREKGQKWRDVFASRNANNRTRWTRPS